MMASSSRYVAASLNFKDCRKGQSCYLSLLPLKLLNPPQPSSTQMFCVFLLPPCQVGATQCFRNTEEEGKAANKFVAGALTYGTENNTTFVVFKVRAHLGKKPLCSSSCCQ